MASEDGAGVAHDGPRSHGRCTGGPSGAARASGALWSALVPGDAVLASVAFGLDVQRSVAGVGAGLDGLGAAGGECVAAGAEKAACGRCGGELKCPVVSGVEWCLHWG